MSQATVSLSVRLKRDLKNELEKQADIQDRSTSFVVHEAIEQYLKAKKIRFDMLQKASAEANEGVFISQENMHTWMKLWGSAEKHNHPKPDTFM